MAAPAPAQDPARPQIPVLPHGSLFKYVGEGAANVVWIFTTTPPTPGEEPVQLSPQQHEPTATEVDGPEAPQLTAVLPHDVPPRISDHAFLKGKSHHVTFQNPFPVLIPYHFRPTSILANMFKHAYRQTSSRS